MSIRRCTWCSSSKFRHVIRRQTSRNSARSRLTSWTASSQVRARCEMLNARPGTSSRRSTSRKCRSISSKSSRWDRMRPRASKWSRRPMSSSRSCRRSGTSSNKIWMRWSKNGTSSWCATSSRSRWSSKQINSLTGRWSVFRRRETYCACKMNSTSRSSKPKRKLFCNYTRHWDKSKWSG